MTENENTNQNTAPNPTPTEPTQPTSEIPQTATAAIEGMFKEAMEKGASDVHIEPREKELIVRFRIDGAFVHFKTYPEAFKDPLVVKIKILADLRIDEKRLPQDGKAILVFGGK